MKSFIFSFLASIFIIPVCFSQDIITKKTNEVINAKVLEVKVLEITYKKFDNPDGPIYTILKSEVLKIQYENGTIDIFKQADDDKTALYKKIMGSFDSYKVQSLDEYSKSASEKDAEVNKQAYEMYKQLHEYNTRIRLLDRHTGVSIEDYALSALELEEAGKLASQEHEFIDTTGTIITNPFTKPLVTKTPDQIADE